MRGRFHHYHELDQLDDLRVAYKMCRILQGGQTPISKPPVDIDVKVAFLYQVLILKRNFKSMSTGGLEQGAGSPCISDDFRYEKILSKDQRTTSVTGL